MGTSRFLKAIKARHKHGPLVVKTFLKPESNYSLRPLVQRIRIEREALADVPNTLTYQKVVETDRAGYLIRQWVSTNLYDRISTRPFLTVIEKKWITFQLLSAMKEARKRNVAHGDLKSENVLVTSTLLVYVADFAASFKQVFLPLNDPSDFNLYFGTSGRRTCYIAPERFFGEDSQIAAQRAKARAEAVAASQSEGSEKLAELFREDGKITEAMDVFSLGCVIAELWRDGAPLFTLMQLFKYREGNYDFEPALMEIPDLHIREMVRSMISLHPQDRSSFQHYLDTSRKKCFPDLFYTFLHRYLTTLQRTSVRTSALAASEAASRPATTTQSAAASDSAPATNEIAYLFRAEADERIERMYEEWSVVAHVLDGKGDAFDAGTPSIDGALSPREPAPISRIQTPHITHNAPPSVLTSDDAEVPVYLNIPGIQPDALLTADRPVMEDGPAILLLSHLLSNIRNTLRPSTKLHCLDMLLHMSSKWLTDEAKLDRVLPYMVSMLDDESAMVRKAAIRSIVQLLSLVDTITPSNVSTFSEYVLPNLRVLTKDASSLVRATYASCLAELMKVGTRYLQMTSAMQAEGVFAADADGRAGGDAQDFMDGGQRLEDELSYDRQLDILRSLFQEETVLLLTDSSPFVKRSLLRTIGPLCTFFGSTLTNDVILSHIITYLNDRSWLLRQAFFDSIPIVARVAGRRSIEDYILMLLLQALSDPEEFVVLHVLSGLASMLESQSDGIPLLSRSKTFDILAATVGFLCHPNHWLRIAASQVITTGAQQLSTTDVWAVLYPSIRPLLRCDIQAIAPTNLFFALKEPLTREVLQKSVQWASRARNSRFWKSQVDSRGKAGLANGLGLEGVGLFGNRHGTNVKKTPMQRNEEDDAFFDSLRSSGFGEDDEVKLVALREYITKLAKVSSVIGPGNKTSGQASLNNDDANILPPLQIKSSLAVQPLDDVTPLTIFFTSNSTKNQPSAAKHLPDTDETSIPPSVRTQTADSSFSGRIARRRLGGSRLASDVSVLSPLEELRRRMVESSDAMLALPGTSGEITLEVDHPRSISSSSPVAPHARLGIGKAQPAIGSSATNVKGTMAEGSAKLPASHRSPAVEARDYLTPASSTAPPAHAHAKGVDETANEAPFTSTYEGQDPYIRAHLEMVYLTTFQDRHPGWGPTVGNNLRRRVGAKSSISARMTGTSSNRRPEGNLIAYFTEHTAPITSIVVSPDHSFFLSGSEDGTVKVWDTARLEKNVTSRSRGTYSAQHGKVTSLVMLDGSHCAAVAATDGSVHVIRVDTAASSSSAASSLPRYGKIRLVSNFQLSNPDEYVVQMLQSSRKSGVSTREASLTSGSTVDAPSTTAGSSLLLVTSRSRIVMLDLRTMQVLSNYQNPTHLGAICALCVDPKNIWLLVATIGGVMCLWDLRFHLLVKTWRLTPLHTTSQSHDEALETESGQDNSMIRVNSLAVHPSKGRGKWVLIAYERLNLNFQGEKRNQSVDSQVLVETWDIERGVCVEFYETIRRTQDSHARQSIAKEPSDEYFAEMGGSDGLGSAADAIERLVKAYEAQMGRNENTMESEGGSQDVPRANDDMRFVKGREVIPAAPSSASVRALLVATEGYASSSLSNTAQVSGGWIDAGQLTSEGQSGKKDGSNSGLAGYMITGGMDRRIRFWDLGRIDKSTSLPSTSDERNEFKTHTISIKRRTNPTDSHNGTDRESAALPAIQNTHHINPTPASAKAAAASLRSPLLTHHASTAATNMLMKAHKDAVTALAIIESPFRCVVAGDYSGNIRVWE